MEDAPTNKIEGQEARFRQVIERLESVCTPESIFLYGSRARGDHAEDSDFEIGVVLTEANYVSRSTLKEAVSDTDFSIFPFRIEDLKSGNPDTPFNKHIYLRELKETAKTLSGQNIIENLEVPEITDIDLISDAQFNLGLALSAVLVERNGDVKTATPMFYKSCLFAARALLMKTTAQFPKSYEEIGACTSVLELDNEFTELINNALLARRGERQPETRDLYKNISFINQVVIPGLTEGVAAKTVV